VLWFSAVFVLVLLASGTILLSSRKKKRQIISRAHQQTATCHSQLAALKQALLRTIANDIALSQSNDSLLAAVRCKHGTFKIDLSDVHVSRSLLFYGEWMEDEVALLSKLLRKGDIVFDIGANIGTHSIAFARAVGTAGKVFAFEPQPSIAQLLMTTIELNELNNVEVIQSVVCESGKLQFKLDPEDAEKIAGNQAGVSFVNMERPEGDIPSTTLDQFMPLTPRLIKIDAEGMEINVLNGAIEMINSSRPIIYTENHERKFSPPLLRALFSLNYDCYWHLVPAFHPDNYLKQNEDIWRGSGFNVNMLCLPKEKNVPLKGLIRAESATEWIDERIKIDYSKDMSKHRTPIDSVLGLELA
jgi:FkbM family methyltransferase